MTKLSSNVARPTRPISLAERYPDLARFIAGLPEDWEFHLEGLKIDIAIAVTRFMDDQGISGAELARRMGVAPPVITRIRRHTGNVTLKTLAKLAVALGTQTSITMSPRTDAKPGAVVEKKPRKANRAKPKPPSKAKPTPRAKKAARRSR